MGSRRSPSDVPADSAAPPRGRSQWQPWLVSLAWLAAWLGVVALCLCGLPST